MTEISKITERLSLCAGTLLLAASGLVWLDRVAHSRSAIEDFERVRDRVVTPTEQLNWSERRKAEYEHARLKESGPTLAILRIASTNIEVPVFDSTSKTALNRGSGHVSDSALPGTSGNIAIAGHRDGFFRSLKDIEVGAKIELMSLHGQQTFEVSEIMIVDPLDVSVLDPTDETVITLITCYPFYFVGSAPDRFVVRANLLGIPADSEKPTDTSTFHQ